MKTFELNPAQKNLAAMLGYFIDVIEEEKYLIRGENDWIGPASATECELQMWMALEVQAMKRLHWGEWVREMFDLRHKFHTEHMLDKNDSDKLDEIIVKLYTEFSNG